MNSPFYENLPSETVDIEIHVEQAKKGGIYHFDQCLGAYRAMTGITTATRGVNGLLPAATRRIFDNAMKMHCSNIDRRQLKKWYAKAMMNYAYQSAILGCNVGFKNYIKESTSICIISFLQIFMLFAGYIPFFPFASVVGVRRTLKSLMRQDE